MVSRVRSRCFHARSLVLVSTAAIVACSVELTTTAPRDAGVPGPSAADAGIDAPTPPEEAGDSAVVDASRPEASREASAPDSAVAGSIATFGRWDLRDSAGPRAAWPGSKLRFRFRGTQAAVRLDELAGLGGPSEWDVAVDGVWATAPLVLRPGSAVYPVASALPLAEHSVELYRRTEAVGGRTQLLGVELGASGLLLAPTAPRRRTFEFLGDSLTNGYGITGAGPQCPFSPATQNFHLSYAAQVAAAFDAEEIGLAYQGKGLTKNYQRANTLLFPELYGRALPDDPQSLWDTRRLVPDAVFVMLGANDFLQERASVFDPPSLPDFRAAYDALLARVRLAAPQAFVFALVGPTQTDATPAGYQARTAQTAAVTGAVETRRAQGDARVHYIALASEPPAELVACDYHPGKAVHDRAAVTLIAEVARLAGY